MKKKQNIGRRTLFYHRLAGVNASSRRRAKMEILKDVAIFTYKRWKDGRNDRVNDSDSRLPSESSIHSSVTVDENVDFLALEISIHLHVNPNSKIKN